jgi:hypothetical protein
MSRTSKSLNLVTLLLLFASGLSILPIFLPEIVQPVEAQTNETQQTEAERILNLCREGFGQKEAESSDSVLPASGNGNGKIELRGKIVSRGFL